MITKIRTIRQTLATIKQSDPDSALTESALRRLVAENRISATYIGSKALLDQDEVMSYFFKDNQKERQ